MDHPTPPLRPPIFCPLCGSEHRFYIAFAEQVFVLDRLLRMQRGETCSTKSVSLAIPGTPDTLAQHRQHPQAKQPSQTADIPLTCPHAVLVNVLEYLGSSTRQTKKTSQGTDGSPRDNRDTQKSEDDPIQDQLLAHNSPSLTEASLQHLDEPSPVPDPNRPRRGSMPPEGDVRRLGLELGRAPATEPRRTESLPDDRKDWDDYDRNSEDWDDFASDEAEAGSAPGSATMDPDELPPVVPESDSAEQAAKDRALAVALSRVNLMIDEYKEADAAKEAQKKCGQTKD